MRATSTSPLALAASGSVPRISAAGPADAQELCERYGHRIYRFAAMVARGDVEAEDLAHDALIKAIRRLALYDPARGSVEAWLWRIVVSRARDAGRAARRTDVLLERLLVVGHRVPANDGSPEAVVLDRLRDEDLVSAVRRLPRRYRTVIALRYGADLTFPEIAESLGTTRMAVVKALDRALNRLRKDLEVLER